MTGRSNGKLQHRGEGHWYLWLGGVLFASSLLLKYKQQAQRLPSQCPAGIDDFWFVVQWFSLGYFVVDIGSCLLFACSSLWIRQGLSRCGRSLACSSALLAGWGFLFYARAFAATDIRCVGIFGVVAMLCCFVLMLSTVIWWVVVDCDACQLEAQNLDDSPTCSCDCCRLCSQLFCDLRPWAIQSIQSPTDLERGDASPVHNTKSSRPSPSPDTSSRVSRKSPMGSSGSKDGEKVTYQVLGRNGEPLFASRSKHSVRAWIKKNLDREKRKGVFIEEKPRRSVKRSSLKARSSPAQGRS
eukprot:Skav210376  [mRNA]  locus=scaffold1526:49488:50381:+ [translate_table: standard]